MTLLTELVVTALAVRAVLGRMGRRPRLRRAPLVVGAAALLWLVAVGLQALGLPLAVWAGGALVAYVAALFASGALTVGELEALARRETP